MHAVYGPVLHPGAKADMAYLFYILNLHPAGLPQGKLHRWHVEELGEQLIFNFASDLALLF